MPDVITPAVNKSAEPNKIEIEGEQFTKEELSKLIGLGKIGKDAEDKYHTKIDKVWPEYTKSRQEIETLRKENEELKKAPQKTDQPDNALLSQEEIVKQALVQAEKLGLVHKGNIRQYYFELRQAEKLIEDTENVLTQMKEDGLPETTVDTLLKHMEETGIKNPEKAYKDMFEEQVDKVKEQKILSLKKSVPYTEGKFSTGKGEPNRVIPTRDTLTQALRDHFKNSQ